MLNRASVACPMRAEPGSVPCISVDELHHPHADQIRRKLQS
jgi:hypothetical protein